MKTLLLTGANGFVGKYFIDKYNTKYIIKTFSFRNDNFDLLDLCKIDIVVHLSALVHQMDGAVKDEYENINVKQTIALAKKSKDNGVGHFLFMSSIKVYGEETDIAYTEDTKCNPQDEYGKSKLKAEVLLKALEDNKFKISIIRTPIVYGYGVKANIENLVKLVKNISILPFGNIDNKRSMIYIGNLSYLINKILVMEKSGIFLASDDDVFSSAEFMKLIANSLNKNLYLIKLPFFKELLNIVKPSYYKRLYKSLEVNNDKTKKILNLKNPYTSKKGIEFMIKGE